jgi:adenylate kinase
MSAGRLVDDDLMADVVRDRLARSDADRGFLLDGYPRTPGQAASLERLLAERETGLDAVVFLDVPEDVLVRRAVSRRRADDREEVVRERLKVYHESTEPLVDHFESCGLLRRVDGARSMDEVTREILASLSESRSWS